MEFKGTKGEWIAKGNNVHLKENATKSICVCHLQDFAHDTRGRRIPDIKPEANAKLIASAPDLLEALILGFNLADKMQMPTESELKDFKAIAKLAIEKALK